MLLTPLKKYRGFTLTELMVALAINALLFTALISIFVANLYHYNKTINSDRLNQQLQTALQLMTNDIRRAGYWANASSDVGTGQNNNPFMTSTTDIATYNTNTCILFTYDHDNNNSLPSISSSYDDERYGFRLNGGAIQIRPPGAAFDCNAAASAWENMTNPTLVTVTALTFVLNQTTLATGPGSASLVIRNVDISLTGQLVSDTSITKTLTTHVRVRNDKFIP